jgi:predicted nucleic acid-binding protein
LSRGGGRRTAAGRATSSTTALALADTNVLVYRFDRRYPAKQAKATELLRDGIVSGALRIAHQAIVEFVAATTRRMRDGSQLLEEHDARREAEELLRQLEVLYPSEAVLRLALRGAAAYQLSWFDAHMWAYAEHHGIAVLLSEDYQHDRLYGSVRVVNPFA